MNKTLSFLVLGVACLVVATKHTCAQTSAADQRAEEQRQRADSLRYPETTEQNRALGNDQRRDENKRLFLDIDAYSQGATNASREVEAHWTQTMLEARNAIQQDHYTEAERLLLDAIKIGEKLEKGDPRLANSLNDLAMVYSAQNKYATAEPLYKQALEIMESAYGPDDARVGVSLNNMANLQIAMNNYAEAESLFKRSLSIVEKALGPNHPTVASVLENYAVLFRETNRNVEMAEMNARAAAIRESAAHSELIHERFVQENPQIQALLEAAMTGNSKAAKTMLANREIVNAKDDEGWTALMMAAAFGHDNIVKLLLKSGADINMTDRTGATALDKARRNGQKKIVEILTKANAQLKSN